MTKKLPSQLVLLGKEMMNLLGDAIREEYGKKCFNMADKIRELYRLEEKSLSLTFRKSMKRSMPY